MQINPRQFGGGPGPIEAKARFDAANPHWHAYEDGPKNDEEYRTPMHSDNSEQQHLFPKENLIPMAKAHEQTPEQFANDPRTWWHGRYKEDMSHQGALSAGQGFHAGTKQAAIDRLKSNGPGRALAPSGDQPTDKAERLPGRFFPLRATGEFLSPEKAKEDTGYHASLQSRQKGYHYQNSTEDAGSISIGSPKRLGYLSTHGEMVHKAQVSGEFVHPNIAWAAGRAESHTGESFTHPSDMERDQKAHTLANEPTLFHTVHIGSKEHYMNPDQFQKFNDMLDAGSEPAGGMATKSGKMKFKAKWGKPQAAF